MFRNGLYLVPDRAVRTLGHPLALRYRKALILGALREDVLYLPGLGRVSEYSSFSHFYSPGLPGGYVPFLWPGPRLCADRLFSRASRAYESGHKAAAFVLLGRIVHLLCDMSIPSHAHRAVHQTDVFEWHVEGNMRLLAALPVPHVREPPRASDLIESMARMAHGHAPDRTNHPLGRFLKRLGLRRGVGARLAAEQAAALIPQAIGHSSALLRLFLGRVALHGGL